MQQIWIFRVLNRWFFFHSARLGKATRQIASSELFVPRSLTGIGLGPSCFEKKNSGGCFVSPSRNMYHQMRPRNSEQNLHELFVDPPEFRSKNQTSITWLFQSPQNVHPVSRLYEVWIEKNQTLVTLVFLKSTLISFQWFSTVKFQSLNFGSSKLSSRCCLFRLLRSMYNLKDSNSAGGRSAL